MPTSNQSQYRLIGSGCQPRFPSPGKGSSLALPNSPCSRRHRVQLVRVDAQVLHGLLDQTPLNLPGARQAGQRSERDIARVDLEKVAQRAAVVAATEAVGAQ